MRILGLVASMLMLSAIVFGSVSGHCAQPCVVGYVDVDVISKESTASKALHEQFQKKQEELQGWIHEQEEAVKKKIKDLEDKRGVLASDALAKQTEDVEEAKKALGEAVMSYRSFLEKNYVKDVTAIGEISKKVVADVANKEKLAVIVAKSAILHPQTMGDELRDVTTPVLEGMNSVLPTYKVVFDGEDELPGKKGKKDSKTKDAPKDSTKDSKSKDSKSK